MTDTIFPPDFAKSTGAKYIVLIQSLRAAIRSGQLPKGEKLLPVRELAWQLGITPGTVARAYKLAAEEGLVETIVGRGTFVTGARSAEDIPEPLVNDGAPDMINFRTAQVVDVGQGEIIAQTMREVSLDPPYGLLAYPTDRTDRSLREALVDWIGPGRAGRIGAEDIVLALGAQNATLIALMSVLHGPQPIILTDALSYPGVRHAARLLRAQVIGVEMDEAGLRPEALDRLMREHGAQALVTSAEAHSPTCLRTTAERRQEIVEVARRHRLNIIEDDCHCIDWSGRAAYREMCPELAWYISGLSKSVSSALRIGYLVAPKGQARHARQVAQSSFYGLPQQIIDLGHGLMVSGAAEEIRSKVVAATRSRVEKAVNVLGAWNIAYRFDLPFLWLRLPRGWRGSSFIQAAQNAGVLIKAADEFALADEGAPNAVRIGLSVSVPEDAFLKALEALSGLLENPPPETDI